MDLTSTFDDVKGFAFTKYTSRKFIVGVFITPAADLQSKVMTSESPLDDASTVFISKTGRSRQPRARAMRRKGMMKVIKRSSVRECLLWPVKLKKNTTFSNLKWEGCHPSRAATLSIRHSIITRIVASNEIEWMMLKYRVLKPLRPHPPGPWSQKQNLERLWKEGRKPNELSNMSKVHTFFTSSSALIHFVLVFNLCGSIPPHNRTQSLFGYWTLQYIWKKKNSQWWVEKKKKTTQVVVLTQTVYGGLLDSLFTCTPSVNFGGPGSSS